MKISFINPYINLKNNYSPQYKTNKTFSRENPIEYNSNPLFRQLSFMGVLNQPIANHGAKIFEQYMRHLNQIRFKDVTILRSKNPNIPYTGIILFDKPLTFENGLDLLLKRDKELTNENKQVCSTLKPYLMKKYLNVMQDFDTFKDTKIKGSFGSGAYSTAFLTSDNHILKLSDIPNFPHPNDYVSGVEVPIIKAHAFKSAKSGEMYATETPLLLDGATKEIEHPEYAGIWQEMNENLKKFNPKFNFATDFQKNDMFGVEQLGFDGKAAYLIDHGCIYKRILLDFADKATISKNTPFQIEFHEA